MKRSLRLLSPSGCSYVVFHRHGHRAPARDILRDNEEWETRLPTRAAMDDTNKRIQITNHNPPDIEPPRDAASYPFGALTERGRSHLVEVGRRTRGAFPAMLQTQSINAYSTNYLRTQLSGQSFLLGLLEGNSPSSGPGVTLNYTVRKSADCPMAFFDAHPKAELLLRSVRESEEFQRIEGDAETVRLKELLLRHLPLLRKADGVSVDWPAAFDYVKCRPAHGLPLHPEIEYCKEHVVSHVTSRYGLYYRNKALLGHSAGPLISDALAKLQGSSSTTTVFSGHDVTLLALLHSLDACVLADDPTYWPDFGCTLVFEHCRGGGVAAFLDDAPLLMRVDGRDVHTRTVAQLGALADALLAHS